MLFRLLLLYFLAMMSAAADEAADTGPPPTPPLVAQNCFACHGPAGDSVAGAIPAIAGLPRAYLLRVLRDYRYGGRFSTLMGRLVRGYSDVQLMVLADYFSRQPFSPVRQRVDVDLASQGRQLDRLYCRRCHGDRDHPPEAGAPRLEGRPMSYLRWTLQDYLLGVSQGDEAMAEQLALLVRRHGEAGLEALIQYYGGAVPKE